MSIAWVALFTIFTYAFTTVLTARALYWRVSTPQHTIQALIVTGLLLHGYILYQLIDQPFGLMHGEQNLYALNIFSMICWLAVVFLFLCSLRKSPRSLLLLHLPLAAMSVALVIVFPGQYYVDTEATPAAIFHILLAVSVVSVFCVAASQALLLALQIYFLRNNSSVRLLRMLPPIETMERGLFTILRLGFGLLSVVVLSSIAVFWGHWQQGFAHGAWMAIVAWIIFALLLWGHHYRGWRGKTAVRLTLIGFVLLGCSYFGSWLLARMN